MQPNGREWLSRIVLSACLAGATPLAAISEDLAETAPVRAKKEGPRVGPRLVELRQQRVREHEKGNASEFAGKWKMTLPAGFEYAVELKSNAAGLLELTSRERGLLLLGEFACKETELLLVSTKHERVDDYIWQYRDGRFVLVKDEQGHGGHYLRATLTRVQ